MLDAGGSHEGLYTYHDIIGLWLCWYCWHYWHWVHFANFCHGQVPTHLAGEGVGSLNATTRLEGSLKALLQRLHPELKISDTSQLPHEEFLTTVVEVVLHALFEKHHELCWGLPVVLPEDPLDHEGKQLVDVLKRAPHCQEVDRGCGEEPHGNQAGSVLQGHVILSLQELGVGGWWPQQLTTTASHPCGLGSCVVTLHNQVRGKWLSPLAAYPGDASHCLREDFPEGISTMNLVWAEKGELLPVLCLLPWEADGC